MAIILQQKRHYDYIRIQFLRCFPFSTPGGLMTWFKDTLIIPTTHQGLYPISQPVQSLLQHWQAKEGLCILMVQHTSASLVINESYDPSARADMETFLEKIAPEGQPWYTHTDEGADDSPSHLRALLLPTSLTIPVENGRLCLGTWQGIYLVEHRRRSNLRKVLVRFLNVEAA
jgi:secondary thiamine-phosphate synthase enzyme